MVTINKAERTAIFWLLAVMGLGMVLGFAIYHQVDKVEIGNFAMPEFQFEAVTKAIDVNKPVTICEMEGEECIVFLVTTKKVIENVNQEN